MALSGPRPPVLQHIGAPYTNVGRMKIPAPVKEIIRSRNMAVVLVLGFSSGLPLPLTGGTLQAWLTVSGIDLRTIGIFSLVGIPYAIKFLWSPFMDRFAIPWLGRRRGWILPLQGLLFIAISVMAWMGPGPYPFLFGTICLFTAFLSASQDIVIDAYRTDLLPNEQRGLGAAFFVFGYRVALLVAGAFALILSEYLGWNVTFFIMGSLLILGALGTLFGPEPTVAVKPPKSMRDALWGPLKDFFHRSGAISIIFFIIVYKLGDAYAGALTTTFLIRGVGFSVADVGIINKGMGLVATIGGALFGGALMIKLGLYRSLMIFGILQMVSNLSFMVLGLAGKSYPILIGAIGFENITGGMGTSAFVALLMSLCNPAFSATQFALLSSLAALGRVVISPTSGFLVEMVGWPLFFLFSTVIALPGLFLLVRIRDVLTENEEDTHRQ